MKCDRSNPSDKWFWAAYDGRKEIEAIRGYEIEDGTYEATGKHFQGNPYGNDFDVLIPHGKTGIEVERTFDGIKDYLFKNKIEGIVFWKDGEPKCKIKRTDFGFEWN